MTWQTVDHQAKRERADSAIALMRYNGCLPVRYGGVIIYRSVTLGGWRAVDPVDLGKLCGIIDSDDYLFPIEKWEEDAPGIYVNFHSLASSAGAFGDLETWTGQGDPPNAILKSKECIRLLQMQMIPDVKER